MMPTVTESSSTPAKRRQHRWQQLPTSYRSHEVGQIADWIRKGNSGCVVGLAESGRSNLLTFLSHRSDALQMHLSEFLLQDGHITIIPVDIFNLPDNDLSSLYRTILHSFYWERDQIDIELHRYATELYLENRAHQDPFLSQMALYDLLRAFENADQQVVLILNRFDRFCATATPQMLNSLRGLRDTFKGTLSYIVGMLQEAIYLSDGVSLGEMYDILDRHVCWVGSMTTEDARSMLFRDVLPAEQPLPDNDIAAILRLSGGFPGLLKTVGFWWVEQIEQTATPNPSSDLELTQIQNAILQETSMQFRLERIWNSLTQEEQLALAEVQKIEAQLLKTDVPLAQIKAELATNGYPTTSSVKNLRDEVKPWSPNNSAQNQIAEVGKRYDYTLARLINKGLCEKIEDTWWIKSSLLSTFIETQQGRARGRVWLDEQTKQLYQGRELIQDLPGLQHAILAFLVQNPRTRHTNDEIINNAWPDEDQREGISDNALQVHIRSIRKRLEPNPAKPNYLVTWRGSPGGYIFYPEGKPD